MTRSFLISGEIGNKAWKLTDNKIKVLDYICPGAELKEGDNTITAWFTSEIPIPTGPDEFYGLPGLILVVEINGETAFMATSIDLTSPGEGVIARPDKGKKVTQEEFDRIVAEKVKEYEETIKSTGDRAKRR